MKKLSKPGKQMPEETIGIDLGDKVSRYCVVNREGEVVEKAVSVTRQVPSRSISGGNRGGLRWKRGRSRLGSAGS